MEQAYLTTMGLYRVFPTLFDEFVCPAAMNRERLVNMIVFQTANMEVLYPQPEIYQMAIGEWSKVKLPIWEKLWKTTQYEYNPIWNYDRTEERGYEDVRTETEGIDGSLHRNIDVDGTDIGTIDIQTTDTGTVDDDCHKSLAGTHTSHSTGNTDDNTHGTSEKKISAFNSSEYEPSEITITEQNYHSEVVGEVENVDDEDTNSHSTQTRNLSGTNDTTRNLKSTSDTVQTDDASSDRELNERFTHTEKLRAYGNIGVTTTQQMIEQEREVVQFNLYEYIVREFKEAFCILVY